MKLFITGTFRSGTTLLSHILNAHSNLGVTYDSVHFMRFGFLKYGKNEITLPDAYKLGEDINDRLTARFKRGFDVEQYKEKVSALDRIRYSEIYDAIMCLYTGHSNWGEKTVLEWRNVDSLYEMFDDIYVLHVYRDPRDVLVSWKNETIAPGVDYLDCIANCYDSMKYLEINKQKFGDKYICVKFEDILQHPVKTIEAICENIGVKFEETMLDTNNFKNKVTLNVWEPNTAFDVANITGISTESMNRWKDSILEEDLVLVELTLKKLMSKYGYDLSNQDLDIELVYKSFVRLQMSPLAYNGVLGIIHDDNGVSRNPLNHFDSGTWVKKTNQM